MGRKEMESHHSSHHNEVDEGLHVVDRPPMDEKQYDEEATRSYSREEVESADDAPSYAETDRQNHLNSLFNGHLMKWKFEAEEGSAFIRVPAFFGSIGLIATIGAAMVIEENAFNPHAIVMGVCVVVMAFFIAVLDGRFLSTNPLSTRAHLRNIITRNFNMFRFVWGRGVLYIMAGILNIAQMWLITMISGAYMVLVGIIALLVGVHASRKFAALGIAREPWSNPSSAARIFKQAFTDAGLSPFSPHRVRDTLVEHKAIVAALEARDPVAARQATRKHLRQLLLNLETIERDRPDLFDPS